MEKAETEKFGCVPRDLKAIDRWIIWRFSRRSGGDMTKVPQGSTGNANAHDPRIWMTFDAAKVAFAKMLPRWSDGGGVGFVFTGDDDIGGVDLDGCRDAANGEIAPWAQRVLDAFAPAYFELSPSGAGFHVLARGAPEKLARTSRNIEHPGLVVPGKSAALEAFVDRRFFTVTGEHVTGRTDSLVVARQAWVQFDAALRGDQTRHEREETEKSTGSVAIGNVSLDKVQSALTAFGSDDLDRNGWIGIGMALKAEFGEDGKAAWLTWMAKSPDDNADHNEPTWEGLPNKPRAIGIGTILWHAAKAGWRSGGEDGEADFTTLEALQVTGIADLFDYKDALAKLYRNDRARFEHLLAKWKAEGLKGLPKLEAEIKKLARKGVEAPTTENAIKIKAAELPAMLQQAEEALINAGANVYQRDGRLVQMIRHNEAIDDEVTEEEAPPRVDGVLRASNTLIIGDVRARPLQVILTSVVPWQAWNATREI